MKIKHRALTERGDRQLVLLEQPCCLLYHLQRLPGAMTHAFLAKSASERLTMAERHLQGMPCYRNARILVWDAYRTRETQRAIFSKYQREVSKANPQLSGRALDTKTREFVSDPDGTFPHGTGGAVDVTIITGNTPLQMGTLFDDFLPESGRNFFRHHPPTTIPESEAARNRELLRSVMERAGFVGIYSEWWHFEFGTKTWEVEIGGIHNDLH